MKDGYGRDAWEYFQEGKVSKSAMLELIEGVVKTFTEGVNHDTRVGQAETTTLPSEPKECSLCNGTTIYHDKQCPSCGKTGREVPTPEPPTDVDIQNLVCNALCSDVSGCKKLQPCESAKLTMHDLDKYYNRKFLDWARAKKYEAFCMTGNPDIVVKFSDIEHKFGGGK